jgi:hypothetical protein
MKIQRVNCEPAKMIIQLFAEKHDLTMIIHRYGPSRVTAQFQGVEVKQGDILTTCYGDARSEGAAIAEYARKISGHMLVIDAMAPHRRQIQAPELEV